jgi:uncharacterized HAD superfamily protein
MSKKLKIGLDLDGVVLYNPARVIRPIARFVKGKKVVKRSVDEFYHPKSRLEEIMWEIMHWSSLFIAPGLKDLKDLVDQEKIELYLITGRYSCLERDSRRWLNKLKKQDIFKGFYFNDQDEQPNLHKEKIINKLDIDIFVEDNYDIVSFLGKKFNSHKKIIWLTNILDKNIDYQYKVYDFGGAVNLIKKTLSV